MIKNKSLLAGISFTVLIFMTVNLYFYFKVLATNSGEFAYGMDDSYIHLSMAKNLQENGIWGISADESTSSSSSPLWTILLSGGFAVFGVKDEIPLYLNLILSLLLIVQLFKLFVKFSSNTFAVIVWVNLIIYAAYLPRVIFMGMEHILHLVLIVYVLSRLSDLLQEERSLDLSFWVAVVLMSATRYESLIIVILLSTYLLFSNKYKYFVLTLTFALLPMMVMGILSFNISGWVIPNSVLIRRSIFEFQWLLPFTLLNNFYRALQLRYEFPLIITLIFLVLNHCDPMKNIKYTTFLSFAMLGIGTAIIHSMVGLLVLRYFFYILSLLLITLAVGQLIYIEGGGSTITKSDGSLRILKIVMVFFLGIGLFWNGVMDTRKTVLASKNIYEQQIQTSKFLGKYYSREVVAVNDIGAVSFYSDARLVDIAGLANNQVAALINSGSYNSTSLGEILRIENTKIIIIPDVVLKTLNLATLKWEYAGSWKISNNVVCASDEIHFFGANLKEANILHKNLEEFSSHLPKDLVYIKR